MEENNGFALLIGIGDYRAFDASMGLSPGTSDLAGSTNDARELFRMCRLLRIPTRNIRVLTSPRLRPEDLGEGATEENLGDATHDGILEGARWLAKKLDDASRPTAILTFSGHGDFDEARGLVLCPTDIEGADLRGAIPYTELHAVFSSPACRKNLTVLLDCCNAGSADASVKTGRGTSLTRRALPSRLQSLVPAISERMFCATAAGKPAYQAHFGGQARGAFSWAVSVAAEQWQLEQDGDNVYLGLSHNELASRAGRLLAALSIPQMPVFIAPPGMGRNPVFKRGLAPHAGETSAEPTRGRSRIQLTGDVKIMHDGAWVTSDYVLYKMRVTLNGTSTYLANVLATNTAGDGYAAKTEYWSVTEHFTNKVNESSSLTIEGVAAMWDTKPKIPGDSDDRQTFTMPVFVSWDQDWPAETTVEDVFFIQNVEESQGSLPPRVSLLWRLTQIDNNQVGGFVRWFQTVAESSEMAATVLGAGTFEFMTEKAASAPKGFNAGTAQLTPQYGTQS